MINLIPHSDMMLLIKRVKRLKGSTYHGFVAGTVCLFSLRMLSPHLSATISQCCMYHEYYLAILPLAR